MYTWRGKQIHLSDATDGASVVVKKMIPVIVMSLICFGKAVKQILYGFIPIKMRQQWQLKRLTAAPLTDFSCA